MLRGSPLGGEWSCVAPEPRCLKYHSWRGLMLRFGLLICVCLFFRGCALLFAFGSTGSPCLLLSCCLTCCASCCPLFTFAYFCIGHLFKHVYTRQGNIRLMTCHCQMEQLWLYINGSMFLVASLLLVARPGAPSSVLAPSSEARSN